MNGARRAPEAKAQRGSFAIGLVVGLLLGLALALAVALYITKAPVPFINKVPQRTAEQDAAEAVKNKNWDPNAPLGGKAGARLSANAANAASGVVAETPSGGGAPAAAAPSASAPVPGGTSRVARDAAGTAVAPARPAASAAAAPAAASAAGFNYFVQAGAYARPEDAETQRAKVGLLGLPAKVMAREQSGRTVYRVRVGPFEDRDEAESTQNRLGEAGIESSLVRVER